MTIVMRVGSVTRAVQLQAANALSQWLHDAETGLQQLAEPQAQADNETRVLIEHLQQLRAAANEQAPRRDELGRLASELCAHATAAPQQLSAIRAPLHDLNERFNRLYAHIGERQHRAERSLLEHGQFEQVDDDAVASASESEQEVSLMASVFQYLKSKRAIA